MKQNQFRERISLGGEWKFRINGGDYTTRTVPGSYFCSGKSEYLREFRLSVPSGKRVILTTEGINYKGDLYINGHLLGTTLPYCHYSYDITEYLEEENKLQVFVEDITAPYGPVDGWCCYGGLIRAIYLEICPETFISEIWFRQSLSDNFTKASASVEITSDGSLDGITARVELSEDGAILASADGNADKLEFTLDEPKLWTPNTPNLYDLKVLLAKDGVLIDEYSMKVGFRELKMDNKKFYLNGEPFFFVGICRHDLDSLEKGQTLSDADIERDLRMIKELGANFVRLVHYPHDKRVIEMADRLGLFVSEESGLWWSNMNNPAISEGAIEVLARTIHRDRSHACVAFWMSFNECIFTQEFLNESVETTRRLDPDRYVSGANCMCAEMTVEMFDKANIDFFTFHPYGAGVYHVTRGSQSKIAGTQSLDNVFKSFASKPLIISEWGGWHVTDNPACFTKFCQKMKAAKEKDMLAGMFYWAFADMYEFNRDSDCCVDGMQNEGLVTVDRKPKINYYVYQKFIKELNEKPASPSEMIIHNDAATNVLNSEAIALEYPDCEEQKEAWRLATEDSKASRGIFYHRKYRRIAKGPRLPESAVSVGNIKFNSLKKPIVISENFPAYTVEANAEGNKLIILGNALYCLGQPIYGEFGEVCANMTLKYADGTEQIVPLRNGIELLTVVTTYAASVINPMAPALTNAVTFSYDKNYENYRIYTLSVDLKKDTALCSVTIESAMAERALLLYGMSVTK